MPYVMWTIIIVSIVVCFSLLEGLNIYLCLRAVKLSPPSAAAAAMGVTGLFLL
jgi:hypothetical protein